MAYHNEKTANGNDLVIDGWNAGITDNPYEGIYDMRNCDATTIPGEVSVAMSTQAMNAQDPTSTTFTISDMINYIFQYNGTVPMQLNTAVYLTNSGGALPNGLSSYTPYYVIQVVDGTHFKLGYSAGGSTVTFSNAGSGTNTFTTINMATPKYFTNTIIYGQDRAYFMVDSLGRAWVLYNILSNSPRYWIYMGNLATENPSFPATGNGLVAWHNYLFVFSSSYVNVMNLYMNSTFSYSYITLNSNWNLDWQVASGITFSTDSHYAMVSINDDSIYFCNGQSVGFIAYDTSSTDNPNQVPFCLAKGRSVTDGSTAGGSAIGSATMNFTATDLGSTITGTNIPANSYIIHIYSSSSAQIGDAYGNPVNTTGTGTGLILRCFRCTAVTGEH